MSGEGKKIFSQLDFTLFVEASAGTGKTRSLIERAIEIIKLDPDLKMHQLVAITFTEKASLELKSRLRQRIEQELRNEGGETKKRLENALLEFEQAEISTIHSFCARLLRLRPMEAGISPAFQVLDEAQSVLFFDQCWKEWLRDQFNENQGLLRELRLAGITESRLREWARQLYSHRDLFFASWQNLIKKESIDLETAEKRFWQLYQEFYDHQLSAKDLKDQIDNFAKNLELFKESPNRKERLFFQENLKIYQNLSKWSTQITQRFQKEFYDLFMKFRAGLYQELLNWFKEFFEWLEERKRAEEVLDFEDLLLKARDLVKNNLSARNYFKQRFKYILVDEFQDTDPLQVEVIFFLAEAEETQAEDWQKVKLAPGKLYLVGDPKQSIYHFRRADIRIYNAVKDILDKRRLQKEPIEFGELKKNHRSHPQILEWVNHTFEKIFKEQGEEYQKLVPAEELLDDLPELSPDLPKPVVVLKLEPIEEKESYYLNDIRELEAEAVVNFIQWAKEKGLEVREKQGEEIKTRPVEYKDFAILYPKHREIRFIEEKLREKNLPFQSISRPGLLEKEEIVGIKFILNVLSNPLDSLSLVGALRSIYFGVSDWELFEYRKAGGSWNWLEAEEREKDFPGIHQSLKFLRELYQIRDRSSLVEIIDQIIQNTQLIKLKPLDARFGQILFNLEKFRELVIRFEQENSGGVYEFLLWLEALSSLGEQREEEIVAPEAENVIKLLTLHSAKGLEFPVVILANLSNQLPSDNRGIIKNWEKNQLAINFDNKFLTSNYEELAEEEKLYLEKEKIRLLYVACTRAKQYLVIPDHRDIPLKKKSQNQYISLLEPGLVLNQETQKYLSIISSSEITAKSKPAPTSLLEQFITLKPEESGLEKEKEIFTEKMKHSLKQASQTTEIISPSQLEEFRPIDSSISLTRQMALDLGSLVHKVLEISAPYSLEFAKKLAEHLLEGHPNLKEKKEEIFQLLEDFWKSEIREQILSSPSWQEVPFLVRIDNKLYRGKIDLLMEREKELKVVDFKTDRILEEELSRKNNEYQPQLEVYQKVLKKLFPSRSVKTSLFYLRLGKEEQI